MQNAIDVAVFLALALVAIQFLSLVITFLLYRELQMRPPPVTLIRVTPLVDEVRIEEDGGAEWWKDN